MPELKLTKEELRYLAEILYEESKQIRKYGEQTPQLFINLSNKVDEALE